MHPLDLYGSIEEHLDFKEEINSLYKKTLELVLSKKTSSLIDIGCGQGDFCALTKNEGITTLGVDLSQKQIALAKKKNIAVQCCDIKDIKEKFQCATAIFDVLNYIPKNELKEFLSHTHTLLEEDGYFIFDINTLFGFEDIAQGTLNIDTKEKFIAIDANFSSNTLYTQITLFTKEKELYNKQSGTIKQYFHDTATLTRVLKIVGFKVLEIQNIYLHNDDEADKLIYITQKERYDS